MSERKEYSIEDFAEVKNTLRIPLSKLEREKRQGDFPYYGASGIIDYVDDFLFEGEHVLISEDGENLKSRKTPIAFKADGKFWVNNHAHILKGKRDEFNDLLVYYFANLNINEFITGAVQPKLSKSNLLSIPMFLPEDEEVILEIVGFFKSLTDKIDLLHRQNQTLEQMAETLFRQWFVEEADEGWEVKKLRELVDIGIGRTPPRKEFQWFSKSISDVKWVSIKDLGDSGIFVLDTSEYLTEEAVEKFNIPIILPDTVLLSFKMTLGRVAITTEHMLSNEAIAHFKFNEETPFSKEFLYFYLKTYPYETLGSTSSIVTSINSGMIKDMEAIIPDDETLTKFENQVIDYFDKIKSNQTQIRTLTAMRDTLLPKLMSGEIRIV